MYIEMILNMCYCVIVRIFFKKLIYLNLDLMEKIEMLKYLLIILRMIM